MQQDWHSYLTKQGAVIENGSVSQFSSKNTEIEYSNTKTILSDLSHYTLIKVAGSDANNFLQGQLSNDINLVTENQTQMSAYCSPKGRALAVFRIFELRNEYFLSLPTEIAEKTLNRLKMFIMRSDVTMDDVTDQYFHLGIAGSNATLAIENALGPLSMPQSTDESIVINDISIHNLPSTTQRYELFGPITNSTEIWEKLMNDCQPVGQSAWNLQRINAGIPEVLAATSDGFVPQMLNLQLINAVNFQKGCYPGQEIVARTKYLGKLKKRLYLVEVNTTEPVEIGTDIYESGDNQQSVGKIVLIEANSANSSNALAVLRISALDNQPLHLVDKTGPQISLLEIPYDLDEENA